MSSDEDRPISLPDSSGDFIPPHKVAAGQVAHISDMRRLTFQHMQEGFSIVDTNGLHVDVNPAFCRMTGFSAEELVGFGPETYWPPENHEQIAELISKALRGEFADIELIFMRKNGERFPVLMNPFAIRDGGGEIVYFGSTVRDITRRTQMQLSLQHSEKRYRSLFENAAEAIIIMEGAQIVDCNEQALKLFGVASLAQLGSRVAFDFFPPTQPNGQDSRAYSIEKLKEAQSGKPQFFSWSHVRFDGTPFSAEVSLSTFKLDGRNILQATVRDVTERNKLEEALRLREQQYRGLFEHAGDGILIMQGEQVIDCNKRVLEIYGISREQLMSRTDFSLSPPVQPSGRTSIEFYHQQTKSLQPGTPQSFEWLGNKPDGTPVETEVTLTTFSLDGQLYTQSLIRDITQRKQLEASIRDSEIRFRTLFENSGDAISILENGRTIDCNKRLCDLYGVTREEVLSAYVSEFFPQTQPNGQSSSQFFADKVRAARQGHPQVYEWHGARKDGTKIITEINLSALVIGGEVFEQAVARDITRRKQLEAEISDTNVRFRTLFEHAGEAISILKDFQIVECNAQLGPLYGYSRDEILSNPTAMYFPTCQPNGQNSLEFFSEKVAASRAGTPQNYEWHAHKRDGTDIVVEISLASFKLGGETLEQATTRDITQRKMMEAELVDLNKTLEDRVAQRTEELERAYAEILQRNSQHRALAKKLIRAEDEERKRIARLLHDDHQQLLAAAKFKAQILESDLFSSDVNRMGGQILEILDQALELTRSLTMELAPPIIYGAGLVAALQWLSAWMEENHQLQVLVVGSLPVIPVPPDVSHLLFRAVRELLFNVRKHSGTQQARVDIVAFDNGLRVSVSDEGCGFDAAYVLQAPRSYGLFSIQEQLDSLGGRMEFSGTAQGGAMCTMSIPVNMDAGSLSQNSPALDLLPVESTATYPLTTAAIRILVADDHPMARGALVQILGLIEDFCVVGEAVDGLDAVQLARILKPDVVLMDATMPRLSGLEATRCITAELPKVKVIALSMQAPEDMQAQMSAAGAACYLQKLAPVDELFAAIRRVMH